MFEIIRMSHIRLESGRTPQIDMGNLTLFESKVTGLIGLYDSGHSNMIEILVGRKKKTGGCIRYMDQLVDIHNEQAARDLGINYIGSETKVASNLSVAENLFLHMQMGYKSCFFDLKSIGRRAAPYLQAVGLEIDPLTKADTLSVAEQHLLQLARILASGHKIVVLDNATVDYSKKDIERLKSIVISLARQGLSFLIKLNSVTPLLDITDILFIMRNGSTVKILNKKQYNYENIFQYMTGQMLRLPEPLPNTFSQNDSQLVLQVKDLSAEYAQDTLTNIAFCVREGQTIAFVDQSGTSGILLAHILSGAKSSALKNGQFFIGGIKRSIANISDAMACGICMLPEDGSHSGLLYNMSVKDNLSINILNKISVLGFINERISHYIYEDFKRELREETNIELKYGSLKELSEIGCYALHLYKCMLINPRILIVINPKAYNDEQTAEYIYRKIEKLKLKKIAILLFTNNICDARQYADHIFTLVDGRIYG
ncbi:MAG: ATP-binding cassette domain-containing protein [Christensenellales bacterium]|jgi:ABC-type sugar transport system ATPase subunit